MGEVKVRSAETRMAMIVRKRDGVCKRKKLCSFWRKKSFDSFGTELEGMCYLFGSNGIIKPEDEALFICDQGYGKNYKGRP